MFLSPGITGNRVIGATDEKQLLVPIIADAFVVICGGSPRQQHY